MLKWIVVGNICMTSTMIVTGGFSTSGDHAGCYARTDRLRDPWYSAAGEQRGILNNVVKLAFNPNKT